MMHNWTGMPLGSLEQTPSMDEPDEVTGNVTDCYICGRNFGLLAKIVRECCIKLEHRYKRGDRLIAYFISVCIWCHAAYLKDQALKR